MNADQVIEGIGKAVTAAKPAQEYCLFWLDYWWWMCMTKSEWASWVQGIAVCIALIAPFVVWLISKSRERRVAKEILKGCEERLGKIKKYLNDGYSVLGYEASFLEVSDLVESCIKFVKDNRSIVDANSNKFDPLLKSKIIEFYRIIDLFADDVIISKTRFNDAMQRNYVNPHLLYSRFKELKIEELISSIINDLGN